MIKFLRLLSFLTGMCICVPLSAQVIYKLIPPSSVQVSGTSTLSDWVVRSEEIFGEMFFTASANKAQGRDIQTGTIKDAKAGLQVSTIKSEKGETMDNKMYKALKHETSPQITFVLSTPVDVQRAPARISAAGKVELAGVTRPMTFDLNVSYADNGFHLEGSKTLKLSDFEIEPPTAMFGQIETGDDIVVKLDLFFAK